jgi:GT2 family glycosyltransferase
MVTPPDQKYEANQNFPKVSIVIVNYNGYYWLRLVLPSIMKTNYPDFEIILVDNGSTDQSIEYLRNYWHHLIRIIELKDNLGFAEGSNVGIREANGEIIAFLNNDIEVDNDWLKAAVKKLNSDKRAGAVQSKIMKYSRRTKIYCVGVSVDKFGIHAAIGSDEIDSGQYDELSEIGGCCGGAMIVWKYVLIKTGFFDNNFFIYYEDLDLSWRIKLAGYKILPAQSSVVYHVGSATSKTIPSAFVTFHITKNHVSSWLKNSRLITIILYWPVLLLFFAGLSFFDLIYGHYDHVAAHLKGIIWVLLHINYILKERHKVQHIIRKSEVNPDNILFIENKDSRNSSNLLLIVKRGLHLIRCRLRKN